MKNENPLVSVVINCFNSEKYLVEAIESVISQTYKNWEIVFWDNASDDQSPEIVKSFNDKRIRYYRGDETVLIYTARNFAINKCKGELISFLDCDDIWMPDKLEEQVKLFFQGNEIIYGGYKIIDQNGKGTNEIHNYLRDFNTKHLLLFRRTISIGAVILNSKILKENLFNDSYQLMGDFELWFRLSLKYKFFNSGTIVELSRQHGDNVSHTSNQELWDDERRMFYSDFFKETSLFRYPQIIIYIFLATLQRLYRKI
jgi:glycosyltransferase involved in cell wall biosynthesis